MNETITYLLSELQSDRLITTERSGDILHVTLEHPRRTYTVWPGALAKQAPKTLAKWHEALEKLESGRENHLGLKRFAAAVVRSAEEGVL